MLLSACHRRSLPSKAALPLSHTGSKSRCYSFGRLSLLLMMLIGMLAISSAAVAENTEMRQYDIKAGPLSQVLSQLSVTAGVSLSYSPELVAGKSGPAVNGRFTPAQALDRALSGSGIQWRFSSDNAVILEATAQGSTTLNTLTVESHLAQTYTSGDSFLPSLTRAGNKSDTPLIRTPQAVNVVTSGEMQAKGVVNVSQALQYTPGVVSQYGNTDMRHDWLSVRGFNPGRYLDGLRLSFGALGYAQPKIEAYGLEQVEVLKGPASTLYGQNNPGGLVNMVSKRPTREDLREVFVQYGSFNFREAGFDLGGGLSDDGDWSYRLTGLTRKADSQVDYISEERKFIAPAFSWTPSEVTSLTILSHYQTIDADGGGAPPALPVAGTLEGGAPYGKLGSDTFIGEPGYDRFTNDQLSVGYEFEHAFSETWAFRQNLRYGKVDTHTQRVQGYAVSGNDLLRYAWAFPADSTIINVDNQAIATFRSGDVEHAVLIGVDFLKETANYDEYYQGTSVSPLDLSTLAYTGDAVLPPLTTAIDQDRTQKGLYLQDDITMGAWSFLLGGRYDTAKATTDRTAVLTDTTTTTEQDDSEFTGRVGVVYEFDNGVAPYAGYTQSFVPTAGTDQNGDPFEPTTGDQYEIGLRYQPMQPLSLSLSLYQLTQQNVVTRDSSSGIRYQTGEVQLKGAELEGKFSLSSGLDATLSYAYTQSDITKALDGTEGNRMAFVPYHQGSAWLSQAFDQGVMSGFTLGGGLRYTGSTYGHVSNTYKIPGITLMDIAVQYDLAYLSDAMKGASVNVSVNNVSDKEYVSTCISATGCYYGQRRFVSAKFTYDW